MGKSNLKALNIWKYSAAIQRKKPQLFVESKSKRQAPSHRNGSGEAPPRSGIESRSPNTAHSNKKRCTLFTVLKISNSRKSKDIYKARGCSREAPPPSMHLHRITFNDILESRRWMTRRIVRFDDHERRELRENAIFVIFSVPLLRKTTKNRFRELSIFVSSIHFYVISTEFEKSIERSI
jgi:hypothetical protein